MFNTNRMVQEYANTACYVRRTPSRMKHLSAGGSSGQALSQWKRELARKWGLVRVEKVEANDNAELPVGGRVDVRAQVHLATSSRARGVELYHGRIDTHGQLWKAAASRWPARRTWRTARTSTTGRYRATAAASMATQSGVVPQHPDLTHKYDTG